VSVLVDTSAFIALLDNADQNHRKAGHTWIALLGSDEELVAPS